MLIDTNDDYHDRVKGAPIFYGLSPFLHTSPVSAYCTNYSPDVSPPYMNYDFVMSKFGTQNLPLTLTPPTSPLSHLPAEHTRRSSVIMKVENCQIVSSDSKSEVCRWEKCYRNFDSLEKLANHVSMSHSQIGYNNLYYCKWEGCQRTARGFNARYKMLVHCRTHTKEKPHFCTFTGCIKAFSRAENLKIHYRSHTLEKPYRCCYPNCQKAYSNSSDRFKHSKTHMNNKPYCCKVPNCSKRYTDPSSLRKHVKTFNHDTITSLSQESTVKSGETSVEAITSVHSPKRVYYDTIGFNDHSESNDRICWASRHVEITDKIETIRLDQPLDLRVHHNR